MATPDRPKRTSKRRTSVAKAPEKPAEKLEDLKAKRMQEAEILRQRMRDAGMLSPVPPAYPVPSATGPSRVQILIEGDDVTIIQHGSAPDQPTFWGYAETPLLGEYADSRLFLEYAKSRLYFGYADLPLMAKGVLQYFGYADRPILSDYAGSPIYLDYGDPPIYLGYAACPISPVDYGDPGPETRAGRIGEGDIVTIQIRPGGRVRVQTGQDAGQTAQRAISRFNRR